ncbi:MAG: FRG domain-containing protein [Deltaproteobacteria bacterium]|nr:FRG domain-containing protein [Deltaproteobacteria bacterium]
MNGQWMGDYNGTSSGVIIVNIDDMGDHFKGIAYLNESDNTLPSTAIPFRTNEKSNDLTLQAYVFPINSETGVLDVWENVKQFYPSDLIFPASADIIGKWDNEELILTWTTNIGTSGSCLLPKSKADNPSDYSPITKVKDWSSYKSYVADLVECRFLFRGQNAPWRLRTAFHKTGRADLTKFINEDIPTLYKHLSSKTRHIFNLNNPDENGAFFNLAQHHGYPTPLLDWTFSPYVAAFFAYRGITNAQASKADEKQKVRIFIFNQEQWKKDFIQVQQLLTSGPHVSIAEFIAIDNERMLPQQAASLVTNIDDIEDYIKSKEAKTKRYLKVIDLPVNERAKIMQELSYMGITAASLFPGLDGACEELKERFFNI